MKKRILLTNDDGFDAPGLLALHTALFDLAEIIVLAPANEKSACAHSLSITKILRPVKIEKNFYKLDDGTPSDCVYIAMHTICKDKKPDLVISGINIGSNMGEDVTYSGTVAGAMEGAIQGVDSIAISQVLKNKNNGKIFDFALAKQVIREVVEKIFSFGFPLDERKLLNINIPEVTPEQCKGYVSTHLGYRIYGKSVHTHKNPRNEECHWLGLHPLKWQKRHTASARAEKNDFDAIDSGFVSFTPLKLDMSSYEDINSLSGWIK